jgi:hypothetical protein
MFSRPYSRHGFTLALLIVSFFSLSDFAKAAETPCVGESPGSFGAPQRDGYRLILVRWDPVLQKQWATLRDCEHPERPALTVTSNRTIPSLPAASTRPAEGRMLVHAGDLVRLWKEEEESRIEIMAISEDNGRAGSVVRLHSKSTRLGTERQKILGVVRGISEVEIAR